MTEAVLQQGAVPAASDKPTLKDLVQDFISMALIDRTSRPPGHLGAGLRR